MKHLPDPLEFVPELDVPEAAPPRETTPEACPNPHCKDGWVGNVGCSICKRASRHLAGSDSANPLAGGHPAASSALSSAAESELWDALEEFALARHHATADDGAIVPTRPENAIRLATAHTRIVELFAALAPLAAHPATTPEPDYSKLTGMAVLEAYIEHFRRLEIENRELWATIRQKERDAYAASNALDVAELDAHWANALRDVADRDRHLSTLERDAARMKELEKWAREVSRQFSGFPDTGTPLDLRRQALDGLNAVLNSKEK